MDTMCTIMWMKGEENTFVTKAANILYVRVMSLVNNLESYDAGNFICKDFVNTTLIKRYANSILGLICHSNNDDIRMYGETDAMTYSEQMYKLDIIMPCVVQMGAHGADAIFFPVKWFEFVMGSEGLWKLARLSRLDDVEDEVTSESAPGTVIVSAICARVICNLIEDHFQHSGLHMAYLIARVLMRATELDQMTCYCTSKLKNAALVEMAHVRVQQQAFGVGLASYDKNIDSMGGFEFHRRLLSVILSYPNHSSFAIAYIETFDVEAKHDVLIRCLAWCFNVPPEIMEMTVFMCGVSLMEAYMRPKEYQILCDVVSSVVVTTTFLSWCHIHHRWRLIVGYDAHHTSRQVFIPTGYSHIFQKLAADMRSVEAFSLPDVVAPLIVLEHANHTLAPFRLRG